MENLWTEIDAYWAWLGDHPRIVWLGAFALLILYIYIDNVGQPWMQDGYDEDDEC